MLLIRYRGSEGMFAWAFHRIAGIGIWLFVMLHVVDIFLAGGNPAAYNDLLKLYSSPPGRVMETVLGAAVFYHALNGVRIILMDFWPRLTLYHKQMWYGVWVVFLAVGIPGAFIILKPIFGL